MSVKKVIGCADIHIPNYKGIDEIKETLQIFINKCHKIVDDLDSPEEARIVLCGDILHNKLSITNESILCVNWLFSELDKICKTIVVIGNHDFLMNNTDRIDSLTPLFEVGNYKQVIFLDKELGYKSGIMADDNVAWCLYSSFTGFNRPDIEVHKEANKGKDNSSETYIGLIHGDVNGAITATNRVTDNGVDPNVFDGCDFVIAGHIHKRQEIKKNGVPIVYCSSIRQRDMGETISNHGFVLWDIEDPEDIEYKFVNIPNENGGYFKFTIKDVSDIKNDKEELLNY